MNAQDTPSGTRMMWAARVNAICARAHGTGFTAAISDINTPASPSHVLLQPFGHDDPSRSLDEREVGERLREVAEVVAGLGVELLGEETERRCLAQQALHEVAGPSALTH